MSKTVKRFMLFMGDNYYPGGGWSDFHSSYESIDEATDTYLGANSDWGWGDIVDLETGELVKRFSGEKCVS